MNNLDTCIGNYIKRTETRVAEMQYLFDLDKIPVDLIQELFIQSKIFLSLHMTHCTVTLHGVFAPDLHTFLMYM